MEETITEHEFNEAFEVVKSYLAQLPDEKGNNDIDCLRKLMILSDKCENGVFPNINETNNRSVVRQIIAYFPFLSNVVLKIVQDYSDAPTPLQAILKVIAGVAKRIFEEDIVSEVANEFRLQLDEAFMRRCRATNLKYQNCMRYIGGLPRFTEIEHDQRGTFINRLASDLPVLTGIEEIAELTEEIEKAVNAKEARFQKKIMDKVLVYCCLVTSRELFLFARFGIELVCYPSDKSILNVIDGQRQDDEKLLRFLYKPNSDTMGAFIECDIDGSPILKEFLQARQMTRNVENLNGQRFRIYSVHYPEALLSAHDFWFLTFLRCHDGKKRNHTVFTCTHVQDDVYTIHPSSHPEYRVCTRGWVRMSSDPTKESSEWRIIKIEPKTAGEDPSYLIEQKSCKRSFMFTDFTGRVYTWGRSKDEKKCLWRLKKISEEEDFKYQYLERGVVFSNLVISSTLTEFQ